jgi:arylsulfatase A-like enzyme
MTLLQRIALRARVVLALVSGAAAGLLATASDGGAQQGRPNIVFLLTDDHRWDAIGAAGNPIIQTPNLDALAATGVRFANAYVTTPICMTSRASFLAGQYERRHGISDFQTNFSPEAFSQTYPALLRAAGYWSGFIGKFGVGNRMPEDQFDVWHGFPGQGQYETRDPEGNPIHLTRLMSRQAVEFVERAPADRPFLLSVSFKAPHVQDGDPRQFIPDSAYLPLYQDAIIPEPVTAHREYFERLPPFLGVETNEARRRWRLRFATPRAYQNSVKNYYRLLTQVDDVVGDIRAALARRGVAENTVIVFMGDNGFFLGDHGLAGKWYGYEESIRVPLIVHDPRVPASAKGQVRTEMALNVDIAPSLVDLAGLAVPDGMQGASLLPLVQGRQIAWRDDFLFEHLFAHAHIPKSDGVVGQRYKYLRWFEQDPIYEQLFDLELDPHETNDLARQPEYRTILGALRERYEELVAAARGRDITHASPGAR